MATPRTPSRSRSSGRAPSTSGSNSQMTVTIGAIAIVVVVVIVVMMNGGGKDDAAKDPAPVAAAPAPSPAPAPVPTGSAKAGKTPARPAPALTQETLGKLDELFGKAKAAYNEGSTLRTAGDNAGARSKQAEAKALLDRWKQLVEAQLLWQEEAQMEEWAQPAEYAALERIYGPFAKLEKSVRMGGGK